MTEPLDNIIVVPNEGNIMIWEATISGPVSHLPNERDQLTSQAGPYSGGRFVLGIEFGHEYPFKAPLVRHTFILTHPHMRS